MQKNVKNVTKANLQGEIAKNLIMNLIMNVSAAEWFEASDSIVSKKEARKKLFGGYMSEKEEQRYKDLQMLFHNIGVAKTKGEL
jgi:hypothetical protein